MAGKKILIVDDEEDLLAAMKIRLLSWGYDVVTASSGEEAVRIAKEGGVALDAIVMDLVMPGMGGIEGLRRIRRFNKRIPVFILTAYPSEAGMKETQSLRISGFIPKGTEFGSASGMLRAALDGAI